MKKEECIEIFERYIQNKASADEIKRLSFYINNNQEISSWLEQQIMTSPSTIDSEVQMRMLKKIEVEIDHRGSDDNGKQNQTSFRLNKWLRIAAMFILPILAAAGVYFSMSRDNSSQAPLVVAVERGQKANITLPDGSKVWLNSQSKLTYSTNFNLKKRELQLDGEAYFEVAHNPKKPFIVYSDDISVEALGTAFGVKAYSDDEQTSSILMRGKIKVTTPDGEDILMPNDLITYDKITHKRSKNVVSDAYDFTGWMHNSLRFESTLLSDIAKTIQRIYDVEIVFSSEELKKHKFTGTVNNNSLESVLNTVCLTSPISFQIKNQKVILTENKRLLDLYNH